MSNQFDNGYALLIGVDENSIEQWRLPTVKQDVIGLAQVLTDPNYCAYPESHVRIICGQEATRQGILDGLEWLQEQIQADPSENSTGVIYYSGHGLRDVSRESQDYYLVPYDVRQDKISLRSLRATDFAEAIEKLEPRRLLVILDCCHAGGMNVKQGPIAEGKYVPTALPLHILNYSAASGDTNPNKNPTQNVEILRQGRGRAVLSSSQGEQLSYIRKDRTMSVFTYHLLEALTGHAQPKTQATEVLVSDVMSYVWRSVPQTVKQEWNLVQEPDYQMSGNFPVALLWGGDGLRKDQIPPDPLAVVSPKASPDVVRTANREGGVDFHGNHTTIHGDVIGRDSNVYRTSS